MRNMMHTVFETYTARAVAEYLDLLCDPQNRACAKIAKFSNVCFARGYCRHKI